VVLGDDFGQDLEALFRRDLATARPVTLADWQQRGWRARAMELLGRLVERLL